MINAYPAFIGGLDTALEVMRAINRSDDLAALKILTSNGISLLIARDWIMAFRKEMNKEFARL